MHTSSMLTSPLALSALALAVPLQPRAIQTLNITGLDATLPQNGPYGTGPIDSSLNITIVYADTSSDNDSATLTTDCSYGWLASDTPGPFDWTPCVDSALEWRLPSDGFINSRNYRVEVFQTLTTDG